MLKPYNELVQVDVLPRCDYREAKDERGQKVKVPYLNWAVCKSMLHENGAETVYYTPLKTDKTPAKFLKAKPNTAAGCQ